MRGPVVRRVVVLVLAALTLTVGCGDDSDDLSPSESEVGEDDTEIVPGEEGPVD